LSLREAPAGKLEKIPIESVGRVTNS